MNNKILNEYQTEINNEKIIISTIKTDKGILVKVKGNSMDIQVNDEIIYSPYDKEEYKYIPVNLRDFVTEHLCEWEDDIKVKDGKVEMNLYIEGEEIFANISTNRARNKNIEFRNWLESYAKIRDYEIEIPQAEEKYKKLINDIKEIGYNFQFAYSGNEYDDVYKLIVQIKDFDKSKVYECINIWSEYNRYLNKYIDMI
ncbi:hypothetical protein [Clostridium sp. M14]|uniref:hypothetical protein n=1 Tax=Clostridium sp. M14 TaxID=2716311 RepID=UPI0013EEA1CA|nr:hypothetical protein [Clostridium sp. M14]MBZ9693317.1 hypothetical protein [Clostridium sp. M14]